MTDNLTEFSPIREALEKTLKAIPGIPAIAWENSGFDPENVNGKPVDSWVRPKLIPTNQRPSAVGVGVATKHEGIFLIDCFVRMQKGRVSGPGPTDKLAQLVQNHFHYGKVIIENGYQIRVRFSERREERPDPPWSFVPVTIEFYSYI